MKYYRNLYKNNSYMMALELINGTIVECYTEEDVLASCTVTTSSNTTITVNGITFIKNQVVSVYFGNGWNLDYLPDNFCRHFSNLTHLDPLPDMITSIDGYFMSYCKSFNQSLILPHSITSIGRGFIRDCSSFNQPITIPESVTSIGNSFIYNCKNFISPLEILFTDPNVFSIDNYSLSTNSNSYPMYTTGVTITGNMTGTQLKTRLPNSSVSPYRKILD